MVIDTESLQSLVQHQRKIQGISAILLPFHVDGSIDWTAFRTHVERTTAAGLIPAVNMDTGYVNLLDRATQNQVLAETRDVISGQKFVAGAFVKDEPGSSFQADAYAERITAIAAHGGLPVIFQSYGLVEQAGPEIVTSYQRLARECDEFLGFELTTDLAAFGAVYDIETYAGLMSIPQCTGAKHSSFRREPEWQRLLLRNRQRPDFRVYTGNDFAIDMIMYGSDYLLGLSTFAPDVFAQRDRCWENGDPAFFELNDLLQYLGHFAFRVPGPAYKHTAAMFLKLRGWLGCDDTHPASPVRPSTDREILQEILDRMKQLMNPLDR